jgi:hypothetical protein
MINKFSAPVAKDARAALAKMRKKFPSAAMLVYDNYNALAIGFSPTEKTSDAIFSLAVYPKWVSLFFLQGAALPDPHKRLQGSGNKVRHIRLTPVSVMDEPEVEELFAAALAHAKVTFPASGKGQITIKSVSAKQRPRQTTA